MDIKKILTSNGLSYFFEKLKTYFASIKHSHELAEISDLLIDNEISATPNLVRNSAINTAINTVKDDLANGISEAKKHTDVSIANLVGSAPETLNTIEELATAFEENEEVIELLNDAIATKANADITLYKIPQELTIDEINQVRENIHSVGQYATGLTYTPYEVVEEGLNTSNHTVTEIPEEPVVAADGAEIYNDYTGNIATGLYAIAQGYKTQATGNYSHSEGWWTKASGQCSVGSGLLSVASGHFSHAEGTRTKATTNNAHSEGDMTTASGRQSHAEGSETVASGFCSHAEGANTKATSYYSHSEGLGTIAAGRNQTAMGKYNVKDTTSLLIVGNGSSDTARKNAFKLTSGGKGEFAGDIVANGCGTSETPISLIDVNTSVQVLRADVDEIMSAEHDHDDRYYTETEIDEKIKTIDMTTSDILNLIGSEMLSTESQTLIGAINELLASYTELSNDDVDSLFVI